MANCGRLPRACRVGLHQQWRQDPSPAARSTATSIAGLGGGAPWGAAELPASHSVFYFFREAYVVEACPRTVPATHRWSGTDSQDPAGEHTRDTPQQHTRRNNTMRARGRPHMYTRRPTSGTAHRPPQQNITAGLRTLSVSWGSHCPPTLHTPSTESNCSTHGVTATTRRGEVTTTRHGSPQQGRHISQTRRATGWVHRRRRWQHWDILGEN